MSKFKILLLALLATVGIAHMAQAQAPEVTPYTAASFAAAQQAGRTIVVDVHADWCPTCRAQQPILTELRSDPRLSDTISMRVDWDTQKDFTQAHRVPRQSTILVFQGSEETARSIAETDRTRLRAVILGAI